MLLFVKGPYLAQIASGEKTTTIRPWKVCSLRPGSSLTFNGRLRARVTRVEHRRLSELTPADCRADGFPSCAEFRRAFARHYPALPSSAHVWVLTFADVRSIRR